MAKRTCTTDGCDAPHLARGLCRRHYKMEHEYHTVTCVTCGVEYRSARATGKFCSEDCRALDYMDRPIPPPPRRLCLLPDTHPVSVHTRQTEAVTKSMMVATREFAKHMDRARRLASWRTPRACAGCGAAFSPLRSPRQQTCSRQCARKVNKRDRRATQRGAYVEPVTWRFLYQRDGAACYLCGYDTNPRDFTMRVGIDGRPVFVAGLEYPSVDHVQALATGGLHVRTNARLAHCYCNSLKGVRDDLLSSLNGAQGVA